jgi:glutamate synthase (ferredoxin)
VPTDHGSLGETAKSSEPFMQQVFIAKSPELADELAFERKLFVIRKLAHTAIRAANVDAHWYVASISARTLA